MKHSRAGGILGGLLVIVLILAVVVPMAIYSVVRHVRVQEQHTRAGDSIRLETPFGNLGVHSRRQLDPEMIGMPLYPGAVRSRESSGGAVLELESKREDVQEFAVSGAEFTTSDSVESVREFYQNRLPNWIFTSQGDQHWRIEGSKGGYQRLIVIQERDGKTHVALAAFGSPAVN